MTKKSGLFPFRFGPLGRGTVITNDFGGWLALTAGEFALVRGGGFAKNKKLFSKLADRGFIREALDLERLTGDLRALSSGLFEGPSLHILVVTLQCNHACVYCRAAGGRGFKNTSMSRATARRSVDLAFNSPNKNIALEFQGGEALLNWPVVRDAVLYARRKNLKAGRDLEISVVTNLSLMDEEKFSFLNKNGVGICTSLDGPAAIHDANRLYSGGSSQAKAVYWLKRALAAASGGKKDALPSALMTTTRLSLKRPLEIVETYRGLGLGGIFIRPLSPIAHAGKVWGSIGYSPAEFGAFYRAALGRTLEICRRGERFVERNAAVIARKALKKEDPNYLDLRSPCGAACGQLAYNWDGGVFTCDEGRMSGFAGGDFFRLGEAGRDSYKDLVSAPAARVCALASTLENQPYCSRCAWKPYCGVCPVHNCETQGSPWGDIAGGYWCGVQKEIFSAVFSALSRDADRRIIEGWLEEGR